MDISIALKVTIRAQEQLSKSGRTLLLKARCYPDEDDSTYFPVFPAMTAIALHLFSVETSTVSEHLSMGIPSPCLPELRALDMSSSNYLRVAVHRRHDGEESDGGGPLWAAAAPPPPPILPEPDSRDWRSIHEAGEDAAGRSATAATEDSLRLETPPMGPQRLQARLAVRALHELAAHGVVHLGATSGPARAAAVRAMAVMADALGSARDEPGLQPLAVLSVSDLPQPDGYKLSVAVFTVVLARLSQQEEEKLTAQVFLVDPRGLR